MNQYPWRGGESVTDVIRRNRDLLRAAGLIQPGPGCTPAEISAVERRIGRPLPPDVREFYLAARPAPFTAEDHPPIAVYQPQDPDVNWYRLAHDAPRPINIIKWDDPLDEWQSADGFPWGRTPFGDRLFWVRGHARHPDGCVLLTDHESSECPLPVVARSLAEYLARFCFLNGIDLISTPGERDKLPADHVRLFATEFVELNPQSRYWRQFTDERG